VAEAQASRATVSERLTLGLKAQKLVIFQVLTATSVKITVFCIFRHVVW